MLRSLICLALLCLPRPVPAQSEPWAVSASVALVSFSHAASGTDADMSGSQVRAAPAASLGTSIGRRLGAWDLRAGVSLLSSNVQILNDAVSVEARSPGLSRLRVEFLMAHPLLRVGEAELVAGGGGAADFWAPPAEGIRTRGAVVTRLALRFDAGPFAVENWLSGSLSPSLFEPEDLPEGYRRNGFRAVSAGLDLRFGL